MRVHLRQRKQSKNGSISLYLEIYKGSIQNPATGKTKAVRDYEYLNLYLVDNPQNPVERQQNKETLKLANSIQAKRLLEIKNGQYGFSSEFKQNTNFIEYFRAKANDRLDSLGNYGNWDSAIKHLIQFAGPNITFRDIDDDFCVKFRDFLTKHALKSSGQKLSPASVSSYFSKFRACLKRAVKEKVIPSDPSFDVPVPKSFNNKREYLSLDELKALVRTECRYEVLKRAFLFSCLTGLRWSDIFKLKWSEVNKSDSGYKLVFHQQKTKGLQYLDIADQAASFLGHPGPPSDRVFSGLKYSSYMNTALARWVLTAGITKNITFHCGRHTFANLQLSQGTEIFTLSKMLGHSELKTTQIYATIIDLKIKEAANKIPSIINF